MAERPIEVEKPTRPVDGAQSSAASFPRDGPRAQEAAAPGLPPDRRSRRRRLNPAGLVLPVGVLAAFSHYLWTDGWAGAGFDFTVAVLDCLKVVPFAILAILSSGSKRMTHRGLACTTAGLVVAIVLTHVAVAVNLYPGVHMALLWVPAALVPLGASAWALDRRAQRTGSTPARRTSALLRRLREQRASNRLLAGLLVATLALPLLARLLGVGDGPVVETFVVLFASIVVEALPFVLLGALVSAAIEVYVPERLFSRAAGLPLRLQIPGAVLGGFAFPVCECGSVPVARRLILRGLHPSAGLAFMLASPILNPIVLLSTIVAYQGRGALEMTLGRAGLGMVLALSAGLVIGRTGAAGLLRPRQEVADLDVAGEPHADAAHAHCHDHSGPSGGRKRVLVEHLASDFFFMGKFVVAGGALAAMLQTGVPQSVFSGVLASPLVGSLLLMGVAFMLSLCSEADAFVAVSFIQFPLGPQLAFLVLGPVIDIKLALLYGATFGRRFVLRLVLVAVPVVLAGALIFQEVIS